MYLSSCAVGSGIIDQLEASIEEGLSTVGWIDVMVRYSAHIHFEPSGPEPAGIVFSL